MCNAHVVTPILAFSLLMFHPSAPPLSDNLFEAAHKALIRTELLPGIPRARIAGPAHFHISEDDFGYMAKSHLFTGYEPNLLDKMVLADDDVTPINDPDHDSISDFSKTTHENTGWFGVPTVCESSVSQKSRCDLALQKESKESLTRETEGKQRTRGDRETVLRLVLESQRQE